MPLLHAHLTRRNLLAKSLAAGAAGWAGGFRAPAGQSTGEPPDDGRALIAITLDLEMSMNFPTWEQTEWNYRKGDLDEASKAYTVAAAKRVKAAGGIVHCFAVGRVFEQENVDWLKGLLAEGHRVGNHTYDHVNVKATRPEQLQFRFNRAPWLIRGKSPQQAILDNIRMSADAMETRLGQPPAGFRTPGGFPDGLSDRPDVQNLLISMGYDWVSSKYPKHSVGTAGQPPGPEVYRNIIESQAAAQPFVYPSGLVEIPMSPVSDILAFRTGRWKLEWFLESTRRAVNWAIEKRAVFDFLSHPSALGVVDPEFRAIDLICQAVQEARSRAAIVALNAIAERTRRRAEPVRGAGGVGR